MESPLITVIIPVDSSEHFEQSCLPSVTGQTWKNLEILPVSTCPDSEMRLRSLASGSPADPRIRILSCDNPDPAAAQNCGLDAMSGEYVIFVNPDDILEQDYLEYLLEGIRHSSADMCCCNYLWIDNSGFVIRQNRPYEQQVISGQAACMQAYFNGNSFEHTTAGKLFRRSVFSNFRLPQGTRHPDMAAGYLLADRYGAVCVLSGFKYRRRISTQDTPNDICNQWGSLQIAYTRYLYIAEHAPFFTESAAKSVLSHSLEVIKELAATGLCSESEKESLSRGFRLYDPAMKCHFGLRDRMILAVGKKSAPLCIRLLSVYHRIRVSFPCVRNISGKLWASVPFNRKRQRKAHEAMLRNQQLSETRGVNPAFATWDNSLTCRGRIAVYTCLYGDYDLLTEPAPGAPNVDYIIFTDQDIPAGSLWKKREVPDTAEVRGLTPQRLSRYAKILPHRVLPEYEYSIYVDANITILGDLSGYIHAVGPIPIAFCWHPDRNCVYQEAIACRIKCKDNAELLSLQTQFYREAGMPEHFGLTENNFMVRRHNDPACIRLMEVWWEEFNRFSKRDQISLPYSIWKCGYTMADFGFFRVNAHTCPELRLCQHRSRKSSGSLKTVVFSAGLIPFSNSKNRREVFFRKSSDALRDDPLIRRILPILRFQRTVGVILTLLMRPSAENIVVFDSFEMSGAKSLQLIAALRPDARKVFYIRNRIDSASRIQHFRKAASLGYEIWTYNIQDSIDYGLHYNPQVLDRSLFRKTAGVPEFDALFLGRTKGRETQILGIRQKLTELGLSTCFYVHDYHGPDNPEGLTILKKPIKYTDSIRLLDKARAVIDIVNDRNLGLTIRPLEAIYTRKKLITNFHDIVKYDFYHPDNIFLLTEDNPDQIPAWLEKPYHPIDESIIAGYDIDRWLERFRF